MKPWILSCARAAQRLWLFIAPGRCTAEGSTYIRSADAQNIHINKRYNLVPSVDYSSFFPPFISILTCTYCGILINPFINFNSVAYVTLQIRYKGTTTNNF